MLTTTAADGRRVCWDEYGDPDGTPTLFLHGTPGGRLVAAPRSALFAELGLRLLAPDRAGYGGTDPLPGRTVLSAASDCLAVLDAVGAETAYVVGGSGGGAHALGVAAAAPERVLAVGVLVGAVPLRPEHVAGQVAFNRAAFAALDDPPRLRAHLEDSRRTLLEQGLDALMPDVPSSDKALRAQLAAFTEAMLADALAPGVEGLHDDFLALWKRDWGFTPESVTRSVLWAHGTVDVNVPYDVATAFAARLPHAELITWEGGGHAFSPEQLQSFLTRLLSFAPVGQTCA